MKEPTGLDGLVNRPIMAAFAAARRIALCRSGFIARIMCGGGGLGDTIWGTGDGVPICVIGGVADATL